MTIEATKEMCCYCFEVIQAELQRREPIKINFGDFSCPLFVTWNKIKNERKSLRGCIGIFEPLEINEGLNRFAKTAAFQDHRFSPVKLNEIENLSCHVSLLTNFEDCEDAWDWIPGVHGIQIHYKRHRATYLPEVSTEHFNGDINETLSNLIRKAGIYQRLENIGSKLKVTRYQSSKSHCNYEDFLKWKSTFL